jgi:AcrR family transcriptional regulator
LARGQRQVLVLNRWFGKYTEAPSVYQGESLRNMKSVRRKPRSDGVRNRDRLIDAAKEVLGRGGPGASLEAVARAAGVGIGTLYRHFPTREALFQAVYRHEVEHLIEMASGLETGADGLESLRIWLHAVVGLVETKRGLLGTLALVTTEDSKEMYAEMSRRLTEAVRSLVEHARSNGELRPDITADDLLTTVYALGYACQAGPDWKGQVLRLVDIFVDGMKAH